MDSGDAVGLTGGISVRGWCGDQLVELTALVATRATRSLNFLSAGCGVEMKQTHPFCATKGRR